MTEPNFWPNLEALSRSSRWHQQGMSGCSAGTPTFQKTNSAHVDLHPEPLDTSGQISKLLVRITGPREWRLISRHRISTLATFHHEWTLLLSTGFEDVWRCWAQTFDKARNAASNNVSESETEFVAPPHDTDLLQNLNGSSSAHGTPFHQVSDKQTALKTSPA